MTDWNNVGNTGQVHFTGGMVWHISTFWDTQWKVQYHRRKGNRTTCPPTPAQCEASIAYPAPNVEWFQRPRLFPDSITGSTQPSSLFRFAPSPGNISNHVFSRGSRYEPYPSTIHMLQLWPGHCRPRPVCSQSVAPTPANAQVTSYPLNDPSRRCVPHHDACP